MKKFKKTAIFAATAALACGTFVLGACGGSSSGDGGVKVSNTEWTQRLTIDTESYDSFTFVSDSFNTYSKEEAAEYGEWEQYTYTYKVDNTAEILLESRVHEYYSPNDADAVNGFVKDTSESYLFKYNNKYYSWYEDDDAENYSNVREATKAEFISETESFSSELAVLQAYSQPEMKAAFNYNSDTQTYEIMTGAVTMGIQFPKNGGVKLIEQFTSIDCIEISISNLNSTSVTVPQKAITDVNGYVAYVAANASQN